MYTNINMIGVDITRISRFVNKDLSFATKILSKKELEIWKKEQNKSKFLASRFAIKEAIFKADNTFFEFNKIDVIKKNGKYQFCNFEISTSNEDDLIIAFVLKKD